MCSWMLFDVFHNRYIIKGTLSLSGNIHIGSGRDNELTDALVMKDQAGRPYIPGSSLKGIVRSNVERIVAAVGNDKIYTCLLNENTFTEKAAGSIKAFKGKTCVTVCRDVREKLKDLKQEEYYKALEENTCSVCRVFGSTECASKIKITDAFVIRAKGEKAPAQYEKYTDIRDSVKIDRDTGTSEEGAKFDYEVALRGLEFGFEMIVENVNDHEMGMIMLGLLDLLKGEQLIGGMVSKGLGKCRLNIEKIQYIMKEDIQSILKGIADSKKSISDIEIYTEETNRDSFVKKMIDKFAEEIKS